MNQIEFPFFLTAFYREKLVGESVTNEQDVLDFMQRIFDQIPEEQDREYIEFESFPLNLLRP